MLCGFLDEDWQVGDWQVEGCTFSVAVRLPLD
jgi:hypothetical protein